MRVATQPTCSVGPPSARQRDHYWCLNKMNLFKLQKLMKHMGGSLILEFTTR